MTFSLRVTSVDIKLANKAIVHRAMATRYLQIVQGNFGPNGQNRPTPWAPLSPSYIKANIGRDKRTPTYVGSAATLFRSGRLFNSIKAAGTAQKGVVWTFNPYAEYQQFGTEKMPARPFFPFYADGTPTQFAVDQVTIAAKNAVFSQQ